MAGPEKEANLRRAAELVRHAAGAGAQLVALPELFFWRGRPEEEAAAAEQIPGPLTEWAAALARETGVHLVAGSILERAPEEPSRCYNTAVLISPAGELIATYRKIHLFDVDAPGVRARESATRRPGQTPVCVETALGRIGLAICYDLRFPELFRRLADLDAEIVVLPSAFTEPTGRAHWHVLVQARAIENQVYMVAPNKVGPTAHGFRDYGHSLIVDPWGEVLADGGQTPDAVVTAPLDGSRLVEVRRALPSLAHRRLER
ncbi:MAG: carbon-nitrogen hydrolase family protein [Candidatus Dadabacteria bacterium]|nr:MAG: carbon-nitrogen hydrolase family protein [Candidatus Dadabacteria bacterium]